VVAGGLYLYNNRAQGEREVQTVQAALAQLDKQAAYHTTVQSAMAGRDVLLVHIHEQWFGEDVPANVLLEGERPWIDLAPPGDLGEHPPDPVVTGQDQAGFWYNPTTGTFRARVSPAASEALTLALYNEVNGTALGAFDVIPDTSRQPLAHTPGKTPAKQYASMANKTWSEARVDDALPETDLITADAPVNPSGQNPNRSKEISPEVIHEAIDQNDQSQDLESASADAEGGENALSRPTLDKN
ncbi:MAG: hypothetical protein AAF085_05635, partial [Planctomycetota bacterium]